MRILHLLIVTALLLALPSAAQQMPQSEDDVFLQSLDGEPGLEGAEEEEPEPPPKRGAPDEPEDLLRFEVEFAEEAGGGTAVGFGDELRSVGEVYQFSGHVEIRYKDMIFRADEAEMDREGKTLVAFGNVILDQGPNRLTGASIEFDLETETGTLMEAKGYLSTDFFFRGSEITKTGEDTFSVVDAVFTACDQEVPSWSFHSGRTNIRIDGFARTRNAVLKIKKLPIFYWPYMVWPVKSDRSSGLLVPQPGQSAQRGASLGLAYYQTMGRSADATLFADLYASDFLGYGLELRYRPGAYTYGIFRGYAIEDPDVGETRWKINYAHRSDRLPFGMRGVVFVEDVSDLNFYRDFERQVGRVSKRQLYSSAYISGNWGRQSFNLLFDDRETLIGINVVTLRQLPEVEYKLRTTRLGETPLYFQATASAHLLDQVRNEFTDGTYIRTDLNPQLSLPFRLFPWLALTLNAGARYTFWGDSLRRPQERIQSDDGQAFRGESLARFLPSIFTEVVGPSFSRIYEGGNKSFEKFKHVIEPRIAFSYLPIFEEDFRIPRFDEIDLLRGSTLMRYSLVNRWLAKPRGADSAREILSVELFQLVSLNDDEPLQASADKSLVRSAGPLNLGIRFRPNLPTLVRLETRYNTLFGVIESASVSADVSILRHRLGLRYTNSTRPETGLTVRNQITIMANLDVLPGRLRLVSSYGYDIEDKLAVAQRLALDWRAACYSLRLSYSNFATISQPDVSRTEYRILISLKSVGMFLDMTTGGSNGNF